jgi:hypothetical protein
MRIIKILKTLIIDTADEIGDAIKVYLLSRGLVGVLADAITNLVVVILTLWASSASEKEVNEAVGEPLKELAELLQGYPPSKGGASTA